MSRHGKIFAIKCHAALKAVSLKLAPERAAVDAGLRGDDAEGRAARKPRQRLYAGEQRVAADAELLRCLQGDAADGGMVLHDLSRPGIDLTELFCAVGTYKQPSFVEIQVVGYIFISQLRHL